MLNLITSNLHDILVFMAGGAVEYFGTKAIARIKAMHPGLTLEADLKNKIESIVDAKLASAGITITKK